MLQGLIHAARCYLVTLMLIIVTVRRGSPTSARMTEAASTVHHAQ